MTREEKINIFSLMWKDFETEEFLSYFKDMCAEIPDYIFTMPSSTSGKYHNKTQCMTHGQIYHVYMFSSILNHLLNLAWNKKRFNTPEIRDCMRCIPVFHDALKCGDEGKFTVHEHPLLAHDWVLNTTVEHDIDIAYKSIIANMCYAHSGEWTTNKRSDIILREPQSDMEFFIHECDILSSRSDIDMIIPDELRKILGDSNIVKELPDIATYKLTFGKYSGKTLLEIKNENPGYISWAKEYITSEPVASLLKKI